MRRYRIDRGPARRGFKLAGVFMVVLALGTGGYVYYDTHRSAGHVSGVSYQAAPDQLPAERTVDEPLYSLQLPGDWEEKGRVSNADVQNVTWRSTKDDAQSLTLYVDRIDPNIAINRLMPVVVEGNKLTAGAISEPCTTFKHLEQGGKTPAATTWQNIDFICDIPNPTGNKVGTGTAGTINSTTITTPAKGQHRYFFVSTDANPEHPALQKALQTFNAK